MTCFVEALLELFHELIAQQFYVSPINKSYSFAHPPSLWWPLFLFILFFLRCIYIYLKVKVRKREIEGQERMFHPLVHSGRGHNGQGQEPTPGLPCACRDPSTQVILRCTFLWTLTTVPASPHLHQHLFSMFCFQRGHSAGFEALCHGFDLYSPID